ncbi:MAG: efflux RND transporter permease subunit [Deltaproteobacteria bacterium]|nr:efflux RND transporter permease subunit [Deltaproteobacteria bacterium]
MIVSDTAVKNRISVLVLVFIIIAIGTFSYFALPRESEPDITIPYVFVSTTYKGVASSDIETSITIPIENKLKGLENVKEIKSVSSEGRSSINIKFIAGTDIDDVLQKVKDKVDEAKGDLPKDLENDPSVFEVNLSEQPIVVYSISGSSGLKVLKKIADDLEEEFEGIPGVLEADVHGGKEREIVIVVDTDKLAYYNIPITKFSTAVNSENSNTSGGSIKLGEGKYQLRVPGEFEDPSEIYNIVVSSFNGKPVYLKNLATVVDGSKEEESRTRLNGIESVSVSVKKRTGENIIFIADRIEEIIKEKKTSWPEGTEVTKLMDKAKQIRVMVSDLENNILSGLILVVIVLLFALGVRNAILVGLSIPFSMLLSFAMLDTLGITLNMVVLFSLTLALGMLVDNAIVIIENIYRYMEQGVPRIDAAMKASSEVAYPIIGSTLTTVAAFFPMLFWPGIMGDFMKYLPITLIVTLLSSLVVALVINPALAAYFMKIKGAVSDSVKSAEEIEASGEEPIEIKGKILTAYSHFLKIVLNNRITCIVSSFLILIILIMVWVYSVGLKTPTEFFPITDPPEIYINIDPPEGADLDYIDKVVKTVEYAISGKKFKLRNPLSVSDYEYGKIYDPVEHKLTDSRTIKGPTDLNNVKHISVTSAKISPTSSFSQTSSSNIKIEFVDIEDRLRSSTLDVEEIRRRVKNITGAKVTVKLPQDGPPTGAPVNIEISGDKFTVLGAIADEVKNKISTVPYIEDVKDDYVEAIPSIKVRIDRQKAAMFGLSSSSIGFALKTAYNGLNISTYREAGEDYDITVKLSEEDREMVDVLHSLMLTSPSGKLIPLTTVARINYTGSVGDIKRIDHQRVVTVEANVDETKTTGTVVRNQAEKLLAKIKRDGYKINFTGQKEEEQKAAAFLGKAFAIAVFMIFLILVTLFNSVSQPLIIMTSVILSLGGAFLGLTVMGFPFGIIMSGVGVISLAGVVVNNAIVLIDYTNKLFEQGMSVNDAIISAGATRLRPVMLTAITTVLGLLPMMTGISFDFTNLKMSFVSESSQMWQSMSAVVIFGLIIATFLTLVIVPTLYSLFEAVPRVMKKSLPKLQKIGSRTRKIYWKPYYYLTKDQSEKKEI